MWMNYDGTYPCVKPFIIYNIIYTSIFNAPIYVQAYTNAPNCHFD